MGERPNARNAIERVTRRIVEQSRQPGNSPMTRDQARQKAVEVALRVERKYDR